MPLHLALVVDEEESLVFLDGAAERSAKLVEVELFSGGCEVAAGIELGVAEILEERSVYAVGSGFCGYKHRRTRARAIFRRVVVGENLEFLNGIDGRQDSDAAAGELVVVIAVEQPVGALRSRSADGEREGSAGGNFAAGAAVEEAVGIGFLGGSGGESCQLHEVASIQREFGHLLRGDDLTQSRIRGLYGHLGRADFDRRGHRGRGEGEIQLTMLVHLQPDVFLLDRAETL